MSQTFFDGHIRRKGKFITPLNQLKEQVNMQIQNWSNDRTPEYIWLGLVLDFYGRKSGLKHCIGILSKLHKAAPNILNPKMSNILGLDDSKQTDFYNALSTIVSPKVFAPLTLVFTCSDYPCFANYFAMPNIDMESEAKSLNITLKKAYKQDSEFAADIRYLIVYYLAMFGNLGITPDMQNMIIEYPCIEHTDDKMRDFRPMIRSCEMISTIGQDGKSDIDSAFVNSFWEVLSEMNECELTCFNFREERIGVSEFMSRTKTQLLYYSELLSATKPLDDKMIVLLGTATYAYKRLLEVVDHDLFLTISGRSIARVIIECYIMMKYLLKEETEKADIWLDYQNYGLGQYKLIVERIRESGKDFSDTFLYVEYMELMVKQRIDDKFIDMDTNYFSSKDKGTREKAIAVDEKDLWAFYYDYGSAFEHGLWGAVRESASLNCGSVSHQYHCVPDVENNIKLKSVWNNCSMVMQKILKLLNDVYGCPEHLVFGGTQDE